MNQPPYEMASGSRAIVLQTLVEVCSHRGWSLLAAHVRTNHVHVIVEAEVPPERVMNDFKAYASRALNRFDGNESGRRRWAHHGSTRWLWKDQDVREAVRYVVEQQGEPMGGFLWGYALKPASWSLTLAAQLQLHFLLRAHVARV
jgi:REP element-mobilizing transposase RayT